VLPSLRKGFGLVDGGATGRNSRFGPAVSTLLHPKGGGPWLSTDSPTADRRARARVPIPAHTVDTVDLGTGTSHLLTPDATADPHGRYPALCGLEVLPRGAGRSGNGLLLGLPIQHPGSEVEVTRRGSARPRYDPWRDTHVPPSRCPAGSSRSG
jgi:hypothetical protein